MHERGVRIVHLRLRDFGKIETFLSHVVVVLYNKNDLHCEHTHAYVCAILQECYVGKTFVDNLILYISAILQDESGEKNNRRRRERRKKLILRIGKRIEIHKANTFAFLRQFPHSSSSRRIISLFQLHI